MIEDCTGSIECSTKDIRVILSLFKPATIARFSSPCSRFLRVDEATCDLSRGHKSSHYVICNQKVLSAWHRRCCRFSAAVA